MLADHVSCRFAGHGLAVVFDHAFAGLVTLRLVGDSPALNTRSLLVTCSWWLGGGFKDEGFFLLLLFFLLLFTMCVVILFHFLWLLGREKLTLFFVVILVWPCGYFGESGNSKKDFSSSSIFEWLSELVGKRG